MRGQGVQAQGPGSAWGVVPLRGGQPARLPPASSPSLGPLRSSPVHPGPALPLELTAALSQFTFTGSGLCPLQPSVSSACAELGLLQAPQPLPGLQASQHTLAFPLASLSSPSPLLLLVFLVQNCLLPWLTSHLPPKTATLKTASPSCWHTRLLLGQHLTQCSVLAQMLQNGQLPRRLLSVCPSSELGPGAARFTSSICPGRRQLLNTVRLSRPQAAWASKQIHVAGNWLRTSGSCC